MKEDFLYQWEWRLAATPEALWPLVSDTNRFNRDAGVPAIEEPAASTSGLRTLRLKRYGVTVAWEEEPFEWVRPREFGVRRLYRNGPVREMLVHAQLLPDGDHATLLRYRVTVTARNLLGRLAIPFEIGWLSARRFERVFRRYAEIARHAPAAAIDTRYQVELLPRAVRLAPGGAERLRRALEMLRAQGIAPELLARLRELIERGDDTTVARIQPYALADVWNVPRRTAVDLCLRATRAGLLDLQWDLICPHCRGAKESTDTLRDLPAGAYCASCHADYSADFEQSVELSFRPNASVRRVEVFPFCVGGPQVTPHILAQQLLRPGEERNLAVDLEAGRYQVRTPALTGAQVFHCRADGGDALSFAPAAEWPAMQPAAAPGCVITLGNTTSNDRLFIVERTQWSDYALTAAEVTVLQEFRDLFASEALRPGENINVGSMAILFTDLRGSTRMYREIGDAPAFGRVLDHFDVLRQALQDEEGALIKTIGDAVMAVFRRPAGAVRTVLRAQQLLAMLPEGVRGADLKAGVHFGPCIGVTLNERLDYFGSTINIAARLGAFAQGGELVISQAVAEDPEVQELLNEPGVHAAPFEARVKGFDTEILKLLRIVEDRRGDGEDAEVHRSPEVTG